VSHTLTCDRDVAGHLDPLPEPGAPEPFAGPSFPSAGDLRRARHGLLALGEVRLAAVSTAAFLFGLLVQAIGGPQVVTGALFASCYLSGGARPAVTGLRQLRAKRLDVDLLMIGAAIVAASIGQVLDGALLVVIFATSGALEAAATKRTADSVAGLLTLAPDQATRVDRQGNESLVDASSLLVGDVVLVRPGERIGADGLVEEGVSEVDQATITGEPIPARKTVGDEVFAGTINGTGALRVRVSRAATDSVIARIAALVSEASATKAGRQLFIEKVEQRYSVAMVAATVALVTVPVLLGSAFQPSLLRAMTFMIVASPCAVVLATMPPLLSAIANSGRHGLLVKSAVVMERLADTTVICFDKTGTLTEGSPKVAAIETLAPWPGDATALLALAASAERRSEHPLARAICEAATATGLRLAEPVSFRAQPGRGVEATIAGQQVTVTRPSSVDDTLLDATVRAHVTAFETRGLSTVLVGVDGEIMGVIGCADRLRATARRGVEGLSVLTDRPPVLLTGDNHRAARMIASEAGITDVRADLRPDDKVRLVRGLQRQGERAVAVGDGINDAPVLAAADVGIAMGRRGSDLTLDAADAIVAHEDLTTLPAAIALSRKAKHVVVQNLLFALSAITVLVTLDLLGKLPLPLGVAGHEGSTVIVGLNGLRLLSPRSWREVDRTRGLRANRT
jgi:heavy metal translocating P-type ATPase